MENSASKIIRLRLNSRLQKPPVEDSVNKTTFMDSRLIKAEITKYCPDDFRNAFGDVAVEGFIRLENIVGIVKSVMGEEVPLWILNKFSTLGHQSATFKTISWPQFR